MPVEGRTNTSRLAIKAGRKLKKKRPIGITPRHVFLQDPLGIGNRQASGEPVTRTMQAIPHRLELSHVASHMSKPTTGPSINTAKLGRLEEALGSHPVRGGSPDMRELAIEDMGGQEEHVHDGIVAEEREERSAEPREGSFLLTESESLADDFSFRESGESEP